MSHSIISHTDLRYATPDSWTTEVLNNFDTFLPDHAAAEKKASSMAMTMISHYPDRPQLVSSMAELAVEELIHFKEVVKIIYNRGLHLQSDRKDHYVLKLRKQFRQGTDVFLLDQLLIAGIIEARGAERFGLIAQALNHKPINVKGHKKIDTTMQSFYRSITQSEQRHQDLFINLALDYFNEPVALQRLDELLDVEAAIVAQLPITAALH